ncbi:hypothetical protein RAJCM14343_2353 [Rhodococcus aetherivorans]|uniref:Transmembrane protein n=2 Tax=Nocardiaceae TaxID=85025 RepID=A0ABQ0YKM3_9NOCA|nr:hypothetical protein RAJCM14343_2353 [Rhodococcus aetherivorans]CCW13057.1 hypothetical protein EBESD8_36100 [Rhodococcus aetherivorans]
MRRSERVESALVLVVAMFVLVMVPLAAAYGTATYARVGQLALEERLERHQVTAILLEEPGPTGTGSMTDTATRGPGDPDRATARWTTGTDETRTGKVETPFGAKPGETIDIWIDSTGDPVAAPRTGSDGVVAGVSAALTVWGVGSGIALLLLYGVHRVGVRRRLSALDREWNETGRSPGWTLG